MRPMWRIILLIPACALIAVRAMAQTAPVSPPNVILIMTDDQGYADISALGDPPISTVNIDRLHAQSLRFTDFHVSPTCAPTRAALLTGRYNNATGVWHTIAGRSLLRRDEMTLGDIFTAKGYRTGIFGKWHLGDNYPYRPGERGFQESVIHGGGGISQTPDYWGNDYIDDTYWVNDAPTAFKGYCTDVFFDQAMQFIERNRERPFFCYLPTNAPHSPFIAPPPLKGFFGMIENIDMNLGRLLDRLDALGLTDNTILIFMTDNGTSAGRQGKMRGKKGSPYEGGHRVPFFIRWPAAGIGGGKDIATLAAHIDVAPTLMELCKLDRPESAPSLHGTSLVPLLQGKTDGWPERAITVDSQRIDQPEKWRACAVMTQRWRLVGGKELYDIPADPLQSKNVAFDYPKVVAQLRADYEAWWKLTSTRFNEVCPIILGSPQAETATLTCHDWRGVDEAGIVPWNQDSVRMASKTQGFWCVEIEQAGEYAIELRRWPREYDQPITHASGNEIKVPAVKARLRIQSVDETLDLEENAKSVQFRVHLDAGPAELDTQFIGNDGEILCGAYYAYVRKL